MPPEQEPISTEYGTAYPDKQGNWKFEHRNSAKTQPVVSLINAASTYRGSTALNVANTINKALEGTGAPSVVANVNRPDPFFEKALT